MPGSRRIEIIGERNSQLGLSFLFVDERLHWFLLAFHGVPSQFLIDSLQTLATDKLLTGR
jgi:hypothetical protein